MVESAASRRNNQYVHTTGASTRGAGSPKSQPQKAVNMGAYPNSMMQPVSMKEVFVDKRYTDAKRLEVDR